MNSCPWQAPETWWCVEVEGAAGAATPIGSVRAWQDVLDRAAAIRRLGDTAVAGYTGLFRIRAQRESDRFYLVCEGPASRPQQPV
ncbi:MAG TPA: hypothetical protein VE953_24225 [Terriglobales bacterium]|nr:hypothetical protein [Terriglobales bacterium]